MRKMRERESLKKPAEEENVAERLGRETEREGEREKGERKKVLR